ncbi:hypothetical protein BSPLISOX_1720 [uncultured Gammaproteobacteria bacterium]|jgi:hypothetical protein|nr:hypothetical protein [uncultured Gammaproteobacteria bacterium]CAC9460474.1 hypothetical protein [uncultured Gammaproteobacteria bacterium]VVH67386.1 hypothetical protein BSPLISOX_1720 [uncultured Gammaproteobacteria bacterium]
MKLVENIGIYKSCSFVELLFLLSFSFITLSILALFTPVSIGIGLIGSGILSFVSLTLLASWYQDKKRNLPEGFYIKKLAFFINGFFGVNVQTNNTYSSFTTQLD